MRQKSIGQSTSRSRKSDPVVQSKQLKNTSILRKVILRVRKIGFQTYLQNEVFYFKGRKNNHLLFQNLLESPCSPKIMKETQKEQR
jgi:hypothetical protein